VILEGDARKILSQKISRKLLYNVIKLREKVEN